ncbi:C-type lectin 37Db [Stomoxys calcitrans]|uniref:C-type lectin domain-containing protein n=1 Tax=Stomoxys calcitrans TaxID=35570 RepID=A0A1I8PHR4_STOCA|nr:C-type lectin 37Db [Stomoxys calcitrans]
MTLNFLKIFITLSFGCVIHGARTPKISTNTMEGYGHGLDTSPFVEVGNKLYHFGQNKASWFRASLICRSLGGNLASIDNSNELRLISEHLRTTCRTDRSYWISGSNLQGGGGFFCYNTGERMTFADWAPGKPKNATGKDHCVNLMFTNNKFQMNDEDCNQSDYYICEAEQPTNVMVSVF